jgi:CheY-like chemotaxis protein
MESLESNSPEVKGARLLVVDDNEANCDMLSRRLRRRGYEVDIALSGPEALEKLEKAEYEAVLLDVMMPGMSGLEVLEHLRKTYSKAELPVLMATARSESRDVVQALRLGANDYVTKPLDFPMVMARLESQVAIRREMMALKGQHAIIHAGDGLPEGFMLDGRYLVGKPVGEGGFAVVYRAEQKSTGQEVAIKVLRSSRILREDGSPSTELERFHREVRVIAEVQHPALVRLIDSGTVSVDAPEGSVARERVREMAETIDSRGMVETNRSGPSPDSSEPQDKTLQLPFLVMEFLRGETLGERLDRGKLSLSETLEVMLPILGGVHALHSSGIVHRDLKPSNVFLHQHTVDDTSILEPKIVDFGIAKLVRDDIESLTAASSFLGTPRYMSPEQAVGSDAVGAASDQYSLGVILYECLSGQGAYQSKGYAHLVFKVSEADFTPLDRVSEVPSEVVDVVHRALALEPEQRYEDLCAFARALLEVAGDEALTARWASHFGL